MRESRRQSYVKGANKDIFGVDFHHFIESESHLNHMEMAREFGVSLNDVKKLKERLDRA